MSSISFRVLLSIFTDSIEVVFNGLTRCSALISITQIRSLGVVMVEPFIKVCLKLFDGLVKSRPENDTKEFIEDSAVEAFDKSICSGSADLCSAVFDVVERQVDLVLVGICAAVFPAILGKDGF